MTYQQALRYLNSFVNFEKLSPHPYNQALELKRVKDFLNILGNPQEGLKIIHVAGSKGKGSTCAFCAYILRQAGFSAGLYTSPHLGDFRERIRILVPQSRDQHNAFEGMIPKAALLRLVKVIAKAVKKYKRRKDFQKLSFFEVYTALAFLYFKEKKVDFLVLETGLGGRLDATNAARALVCAITPVSYEHTRVLGKTLKKIAAEKSGIIKAQGAIALSASQNKEAAQVIQKKCLRLGVKLYAVGKDIKYFKQGNNFTVRGLLATYRNLHTRLIGRHQLANASLAVGMVEAIKMLGYKVSLDSLRRGIYNTFWPGRCEIISRRPWIVLDGAQNLASAKVLKAAIRENFPSVNNQGRDLILVLGICADKDIAGICRTLGPLARKIILTRADNPRSAGPQQLAGYFSARRRAERIFITDSVRQAKALALRNAKAQDLVLVTGSLFVVGEFRDA